jgi:sugar/nucleoside kinase (ribokinase family)
MICIVGALAVDLLIQKDRFLKGTSNPASIRFHPGGVGYRIYSHLECPKMLFTALGTDGFGKWLIENMTQPQWVNPIFLDQYPTACYCALMQSGELLYGAADMAVIEQGLSWARLRARLPELGAKDFLVLEANLAPELVRSLIRHAGTRTRVVFESVSVEKLLRHAENLRNLHLLSGNEAEARALGEWLAAGQADSAGRLASASGGGSATRGGSASGRSSASSRGSATGRASRSDGWVQEFLAQRNIEQLLVTRGRRGVRLYQRKSGGGLGNGGDPGSRGAGARRPIDIAPGRFIETADTTGAGDTLVSAYLEALDREADTAGALRRAVESVERSIEEGTL